MNEEKWNYSFKISQPYGVSHDTSWIGQLTETDLELILQDIMEIDVEESNLAVAQKMLSDIGIKC
jgi:hypothetical protein